MKKRIPYSVPNDFSCFVQIALLLAFKHFLLRGPNAVPFLSFLRHLRLFTYTATAKFMLVITIATCVSCSPVYYVPASHQVPGFTKAKQYHMEASASQTPSSSGFEGRFAIAPYRRMAVLGSISRFQGKAYAYPNQTLIGSGDGSLAELGLGFFKPGKNKTWVLENYTFLGTGNVSYRKLGGFPFNDDQYLSASLTRLSNQTSLSYLHDLFEVAFSGRLIYLNYYHIKGNLDLNELNNNLYLSRYPHQLLFEPGLSLRLGYKNVKLSANIIHAINLSHRDFEQDDINVGLGLSVRF
ncbi:MAG: hypothetical protein IPN29_20215 [Saprospiraceae bacterium]|nr:hypothetical protein [Saprospiraceae bacterium]